MSGVSTEARAREVLAQHLVAAGYLALGQSARGTGLEAIVAAMLAFAADAPPGWKLVPVEPTEAMVAAWENACPDAGWKAMQDMSDSEANVALVAAEWSAMLSAAPTPEAAKEVG